jgi:hypothetical protein
MTTADSHVPVLDLDASNCSVTFEGYVASATPVILRWQKPKHPSFAAICLALRDSVHDVRVYKPNRLREVGGDNDIVQREVEEFSMRFEDYLAALRNGDAQKRDMYWAMQKNKQFEVVADLAAVEQVLGLPSPGEDSPLFLWLGPPGHREQLHYDEADNLHMQLAGRKLWSLFPPSCLQGLYPVPMSSSLMDRPNYSRVNIDLPDLAAFPDLATALPHRVDIVLETGDTLFLPKHWWHQVSGLLDSPGRSAAEDGSDTNDPAPGISVVCSANRFLPLPKKVYKDETSSRPAKRMKTIQLMVPHDVKAGDTLTFHVPGHPDPMELPLPEGCQPGEVLEIDLGA